LGDVKTTTTATTMTATTTTNNKRIRSLFVAKYIGNVQQANKGTAAQYEYRLSKFEEYVVKASEEEKQQLQQQNQELMTLDDVINELKKNGDNNKIDPYDLLSGFVAYLEGEGDVENPNTMRYFVTTARLALANSSSR
jgi:hypothetical protein